jgi:hypothetical protein
MADPTARATLVTKLEPGQHFIPVGDMHLMISAEIWDVDPKSDADADHTLLAAIFPDHHAQVISPEAEPLRGRPVHFVFRRGAANLELWPRPDKTYWFRATFRPPVQYGAP